MCLIEDEVQKERQEAARAAVDRITRETPRQISTEMYVRSVALTAYAEGWNAKAADLKTLSGEEEEDDSSWRNRNV